MSIEDELMAIVAKGNRAKELLRSACWMQDVLSYLEGRAVELGRGAAWKPGNLATIDAAGLGSAYQGGRMDECGELKNRLEIWVEQGNIANEKLQKITGGKNK